MVSRWLVTTSWFSSDDPVQLVVSPEDGLKVRAWTTLEVTGEQTVRRAGGGFR